MLEEQIQAAVTDGYRRLNIEAFGQHGIGGRLFKAGDDPVTVRITGHPGQRVGAMGFPNTQIEIFGPASDDVGWLNAGAQITIHGNAGNGVANGMAQGKIYIEGNIGARGMTMTKHNPRFDPPELWILGGAGDYFGEFMAGGVAVICGYEPQEPDSILGYRPLVGMVSGKVFFRGHQDGYSTIDAKQILIDDDAYAWLHENLKVFLETIGRGELLTTLAEREKWQLIRARTPMEKKGRTLRAMTDFRLHVWDKELGDGGLVGDLTNIDRRPIPLVPTGALRRYVPVWENRQYAAPCEATCPTGIPVQERWRLIREGRLDEAVDLALAYTPFPATVCGYLCANPCMTACTKQTALIDPVDVTLLRKASINAGLPEIPPTGDTRIGVIGGGPAGISVAWQLRLKGHDVVVYDTASRLAGEVIPADTVFVSIGDAPEIDFLSDDIQTDAGFVGTDEYGQTSAPNVFAIGDAVKPGLLTDAIGAGRRAADAIDDIAGGRRPAGRLRPVIDTRRVTLEYFDPRITEYTDADHCGSQCSSCGTCRDCEICISLCPQAAIARNETENNDFEYIVDAYRCIGCGFCAAVCPCGV